MADEGLEEEAPVLIGTMTGSFVYNTIKDRWPKIVTKIVNHFHTNRSDLMDEHGNDAEADLKSIIATLSELRYRMMTDKPILELQDEYDDLNQWNEQLRKFAEKAGGADQVTWYRTPWLFTECYLYRLIYGKVYSTDLLYQYDWFQEGKQQAFDQYEDQIKQVIYYFWTCTHDIELEEHHVKDTLRCLLKMSLWGNMGDLSLSGGDHVEIPAGGRNPVVQASKRDEYILVDDVDKVIAEIILNLRVKEGVRRVDIILDNAGLEFVADLLVAEFLLKAGFADKVVLHGKAYPWFVSDVTEMDLKYTLAEMLEIADVTAKALSHKWTLRLQTGELSFKADKFWTTWHTYEEMKDAAPELHTDLNRSSLLIVKGDLNYRKLVGDRAWPWDTNIKRAVGDIQLPPILALRTNKSETIAGLSQETVDELEEKFGEDTNAWMVTGEYAVGQLIESEEGV